MFQPFIAATSIATLVSLSTAGILQAADAVPKLTLKPLEAVSFQDDGIDAVAYFLSDGGSCKVVVTAAGEPDWAAGGSFTAHRFETAIPGGASPRDAVVGSTELTFKCWDAGQALDIKVSARQFAEARK